MRFGNGRPRADVTFLHRYVPRMYVRRIFNEGGVFLERDNVCECVRDPLLELQPRRKRDKNNRGCNFLSLLGGEGEVEVLETGRTCRFVRLATVRRW